MQPPNLPRTGSKIGYETASENWSYYRLNSGYTVRLRFIPIWFRENLDEAGKPKFHPSGEPEITVHGQVVIGVDKTED
ncbi:MAG: hypothetical protein F4Y20_10515 [Acidobacteria bacterium]|nr:hypothetical protein [Acidobacteriota bacterium]MYH21847.1 hypothetical protein [Acidobacteriota bacterium]MYK79664.1 hypothetical protein [Acidobacteriota bacterium]